MKTMMSSNAAQPTRMIMYGRMQDDEVGEITIYGVIGWYDPYDPFERNTGGQAVRESLEAVKDAKRLIVHMCSPGGYVDEGMHMMDMIAQHKATEKHGIIEGECCSAATLPMLACNTIAIYAGSDYMIHEPVGITWGKPQAISKYGEELAKKSGEVAKLYSKKTGRTPEEMARLMEAETWMTAEEAVEYGFATEVMQAVAPSATMGAFRMTRGDMLMTAERLGYKRMPDRFMSKWPEAASDATPGEAKKDGGSDAGGDAMNNTQSTGREDMKMTREELQKDHPELMAQLIEEGRATGMTEERARLQALDGIMLPGCEQMVADAKYGDKPLSAQEIAVEMLRKQMQTGDREKEKGKDFMGKRKDETETMKDVRGQSAQDNDDSDAEKTDASIKAFAQMANQSPART